MKKYVCMETETVYTLSDLLKEWDEMEKDEFSETFREFMRNANWWNGGTIAEILTAETSRFDVPHTVSLCRVWDYSETEFYTAYLDPETRENLTDDGYRVEIV